MKFPFSFPPLPHSSQIPEWTGRGFVFGDQRTPVLEYSENFDGWSDGLTALHEEVAKDTHPIDVASRKDALAQVKRCLPSSESVILEIGCSSGFFIRDLVKSFPDATIVGADVVKEPLYRLAKDYPGVPLIRFDLLQCPLPDQSIDVLVMLNVLEHIEDDVGALKKIFNLLRSGGSLIIEVPACPFLYDAYDAELHHFRRYSVSELQRKLGGVGFKVCRKSHLGFALFPAFLAVKLVNKWLPVRRKKTVVRDQAARTSESRLMKLAMDFELSLLSRLTLPFGIRILMVAKK
jgi:SAM-dependent methyltransferase